MRIPSQPGNYSGSFMEQPRGFSSHSGSHSIMSGQTYAGPPQTRGGVEYEFLWPGGPVGLTLRRHASGLPAITGFTGKGTSPDLSKVSIGDTLVAVQNATTVDKSFDEVMQTLRTCQKPCILRFRKDSSALHMTPTSHAPTASSSFVGMAPQLAIPVSSASFTGSQRSPPMRTPSNINASFSSGAPRIAPPNLSMSGHRPPPGVAATTPNSGSMQRSQTSNGSGNGSPSAGSTKVILPPLLPGEYEILWERGPLGISIKAHPSGMPVVARKTGKGESIDLSRVAVGDFLACINERQTIHLQFQQVLQILSSIPRPVVLRFRQNRSSPTPSASSSFANATSHNSLVGYGVGSANMSFSGNSIIDPNSVSVSNSFVGVAPGNAYVPPLGEGEYEILWERGRLGLSMRRHPDKNIPIIAKITATPDMSFVRECKMGDELLFVNNQSTQGLGFKNSLQYLATAQKPCLLRFRVKPVAKLIEPIPQSADPPGVYRIVWEYGPLGFTMKEDRMSRNPVVARLTGKGTYPDITRISAMDMLLSVNDKHTADLGFNNTMEFLKNVQKPCLLRFKDTNSDKDTVFEYGSDTETVIDDDYQAMIFNDRRYNNPFFDSFPEERREDLDPLVREARAAGQFGAFGFSSSSPGQDEVFSIGSGQNSINLGSMDSGSGMEDMRAQAPSPPRRGVQEGLTTTNLASSQDPGYRRTNQSPDVDHLGTTIGGMQLGINQIRDSALLRDIPPVTSADSTLPNRSAFLRSTNSQTPTPHPNIAVKESHIDHEEGRERSNSRNIEDLEDMLPPEYPREDSF